ncbi:MAG TPA: SRPBCC domain-containing protein [Steroidobacteraceae bacterium]|nr:SRPBCC domain-containing protein [Steroidobacteraceae bacterium]
MTETVLVRRIAARPAIVFDALVTADGIASWWGPDDQPALSAVVDSRVNGSFRVRFRTSDGREHECTGEFLEIERPQRVILSWRWAIGGEPDEADNVSRLEFRLRAIDTGTELTLLHSALRTEASARSHEWGWDGALKKLLRRYLETDPAH